MSKFTNPLNGVRIASPCSANWNEMIGDERKRHCAECKLNVYNLSEMSQTEAENFLINAEGRVCLRIFRRGDGTVLTKDCPVGWQKLKKRAAHLAAGVFTLVMTFLNGLFFFKMVSFVESFNPKTSPYQTVDGKKEKFSFDLYGILENLPEIKMQISKNRR